LTPGFSPRFSALAKTDSARDGGCFPRDASSRERPPPLRMMAPIRNGEGKPCSKRRARKCRQEP